MNRQKNFIWANVVIGGLLLATLSACSNDEPAATTGTPAPSNASATDVAPIVGASAAASTSASTAPDTKASTASSDNKTSSGVKAEAPSKPLVAGEVKPDKPLPAEDVKPKAVPEAPKLALAQGGLSESQIKTMKTLLDDAKKALDSDKIDDAVAKYNEFAGGPWEEAAKELKTKAVTKHDAIAAIIKTADEASKGKDKAKLSKAITDLSAAIEKAKK